MSWGAIVVGGIGLIMNAQNQAKNRDVAEGIADDALAVQKEQQRLLEKQKAEYRRLEFKNPFADMSNFYEDLTVNQQQAQFQVKQGQQQRANIMQAFKGAAGASGVASLAQAMANQGQLQLSQISASIGAQEARNQALVAKGAQAAEITERQGEQWVQQAEMDRQATLLGMQMGEAAGANLALQQAQANQMNAMIAGQQMEADYLSAMATGVSGYDWGAGNTTGTTGTTGTTTG